MFGHDYFAKISFYAQINIVGQFTIYFYSKENLVEKSLTR